MNIRYKKSLGQNFLISIPHAIALVDAAEINANDTVLEVGAGEGMVTQFLADQAKKVLAIEIDDERIPILKKRFKQKETVQIVHTDILSLDPQEYNCATNKYKVVGSLPYNISKKIIQKFLESPIFPTTITVIIQKEVAEDYTAEVPKATFLSTYAQIFSTVQCIDTIPQHCFNPEPKVEGAIIQFKTKKQPEVTENRDAFVHFLKKSFINPRKKLINNLSREYNRQKAVLRDMFKKVDIAEDARAANLTLTQWKQLFDIIARS